MCGALRRNSHATAASNDDIVCRPCCMQGVILGVHAAENDGSYVRLTVGYPREAAERFAKSSLVDKAPAERLALQAIDKVLRTLSMGLLRVKMPLMAAFFPPI